jgi:TolB protein
MPAAGATICYSDARSVYLLQPGTSKPAKLFNEKQLADVQVSPAGDAVAFTRDTSGKNDSVKRQISVYDLNTSKSRVLKNCPGENNNGAHWSPDGKWLVYRHYELTSGSLSGWEIGLVRADDSEGRIIVKHSNDKAISIEPTWWSPDGQSFWAYDLDNFYQFDLAGKELKRVPFNEMLKDVEQSSGYAFSLSPDGKTLLFSALKEVKDVDADGYPASLIFTRDMETGKCTRVSPQRVQAGSPGWLPGQDRYVYVQNGSGKSSGIYTQVIGEPTAKPLVPGKFAAVSSTR